MGICDHWSIEHPGLHFILSLCPQGLHCDSPRPCFEALKLGSTCFWAIRIHYSEVWIRILLSSSKNIKKNLDSYCFVTSFGLFVFEKWCKCTFKKQKNFFKIRFFSCLEGQWRKQQDPDQSPDPLVRGMGPRIRIRIHTKMTWIRNTGILTLMRIRIQAFTPLMRIRIWIQLPK
jgi:hypothetical protein